MKIQSGGEDYDSGGSGHHLLPPPRALVVLSRLNDSIFDSSSAIDLAKFCAEMRQSQLAVVDVPSRWLLRAKNPPSSSTQSISAATIKSLSSFFCNLRSRKYKKNSINYES